MAFEFPIRVYWEDTDAGGIVFYANYLKFFERARTEWLRSLGVGQQRLREQTGGMFVVTDAQLRFTAVFYYTTQDSTLKQTTCYQRIIKQLGQGAINR